MCFCLFFFFSGSNYFKEIEKDLDCIDEWTIRPNENTKLNTEILDHIISRITNIERLCQFIRSIISVLNGSIFQRIAECYLTPLRESADDFSKMCKRLSTKINGRCEVSAITIAAIQRFKQQLRYYNITLQKWVNAL